MRHTVALTLLLTLLRTRCAPHSLTTLTYPPSVVIGAGKTGADAVLLLLRRGVPATRITWVVSQDCWYFNRDNIMGSVDTLLSSAVQMLDALLAAHDADAFFLAMERCGLVGRIDPHGAVPRCFRGAVLDTDELQMLRDMHTASRVVRLGRVTAVDAAGLALERGRIPMPSLTDTLVLDASASAIDSYECVPKPFEGEQIQLTPCYLFNIAVSGAIFGWLEANVRAAHGLSADERKNSSVWTSMPPAGVPFATTIGVVRAVYAFIKTDNALGAVGARPWLMQARLYYLSRKHVPPYRLLWTGLGPAQLLAKRARIVSKFEAGGFAGAELLEHWKPLLEAEKAAAAKKAAEAAEARRTRIAPLMRCVAQCIPKVA